MLTVIAVLTSAAALFAFLAWLSVRRYQRTEEREGLLTIHGVNRNGHDPDVIAVLNQTGDELEDIDFPPDFRIP